MGNSDRFVKAPWEQGLYGALRSISGIECLAQHRCLTVIYWRNKYCILQIRKQKQFWQADSKTEEFIRYIFMHEDLQLGLISQPHWCRRWETNSSQERNRILVDCKWTVWCGFCSKLCSGKRILRRIDCHMSWEKQPGMWEDWNTFWEKCLKTEKTGQAKRTGRYTGMRC
jgi:hypothetical protein